MKSSSSNFWLCVSLIANFVLLAGLLAVSRHPKPSSNVESGDHPAVVAPLSTASIETSPTNLLSCVATLRNAGAPNRILARMVLEDFDERWQQRLEDMQARYARGELDSNPLDVLNADRAEEQEKELRAALGEAGFKEWDLAQTLQSLNLKNVSLSVDETNAIYSLHRDLQLKLRALDAERLRGNIDQEEYGAACTAAQQDNDEKMKQLLGAERLAMVQSPAGETDIAFEHALHKVNVSSDQINSVLKLQQNYAARRAKIEQQIQENPDDPTVASLDDQLHALDVAQNQERQTILGADASEALQKEQDYRYQSMKQHAAAWNLNDSQIDLIYQDILSYQKSVDDYQREALALESRG